MSQTPTATQPERGWIPPAEAIDRIDPAAADFDALDLSLIDALASGLSMTEAAGAVGLSASAAYRRGRRPMFRAAVNEKRGEAWRPIAAALRSECLNAVMALARIRDDASVHASTRVRACEAILNQATRFDGQTIVGPELATLQADTAHYSIPGDHR